MTRRSKVTLVNRTGRLLPFNLPHEQWCEARGECSCSVQQVIMRDAARVRRGQIATKGEPVSRPVTTRTPNSFTLLPHERKTMDAAVLECDCIQAAKKARTILVR